jgi:D-alanine-D-alanine ligase
MKIEIITTPNDDFKETGFGTLKSCKSVLRSIKKLGH